MAGPGRERALELLLGLVGEWEGTGRGEFPTIEDFEYRERLAVTAHGHEPVLHYTQHTWRGAAGSEVRSHWESGFVRVAGSGSVEMINVQESWRQEAMDGSLEETPDGWLLHLVGRHFVLAPNVAATERTLRLSGESLSYEMSMATDRVPELVFHVTADLRRAAS